MEETETIQTITKTYEEKIVELQKQHQQEIENVKVEMNKEKEKEISELKAQHNKELADFILGRKEIKKVEKNDEENDKSFFDNAVENTKKKLKGGK